MRVNRPFIFSILMIFSILLSACGPSGDAQVTPVGGTPAAPGTVATTAATSPAGGTAASATPGTSGGTGAATTTPAVPVTGATETVSPTLAGAGTPAGAGTSSPTAAATGAAGGGVTVGSGKTITLPANCTNVSLTYWNPFTGPDGPFMGQMVDAFNNSQQNVKVTMNSQADYYTQLTTAAASDTLPDVAIIHADQVATQTFRNVLRPIDELSTNIGISEADFPAAVWGAGLVNGKRYSIPLDIHPMTMYYNADLMKTANLSNPPKTREEFEAAAQAMTANGNNGFMLTNGFPVAQIFQMLLHQYGGSEFNQDGSQVTWNSDAGVQAMNWLLQAQKSYSQPNLEVDADLNAFKTGKVGMIWNGIWQLTNVTGNAVDFDGQATSVPQIGPQMAVWAGSHQLTLPVHKSGDDACKDAAAGMFIQYLISNSITWSKAGQIPASNAVRNSADFKALQPQANIAATVENAFFPPSVPGISDALAPMGEAVGALMAGQATDVKATLDSSAQRGNEILAQNKSNYGSAPKAP